MFGFAEAITLLFALGGLGVDANPKAPTADAVLEHAVDDADVIVHLDAAAVIPRNYKVIADLAKNPTVQASPSLRDMATQLGTQVEQLRTMAKSMAGVDPTTDISSLTVFVKLKPAGEPDGMVAVRGKLPPDLIKKLSALTGGKIESVDGRDAASVGGETYAGMTKGGVLLFGSEALVKPRIADGWKAPARAKDSPNARFAQILAGKPFLATLVRPSAAMLKDLAQGEKNAATDLLSGLEVGTWALYHDGMSWTWSDRTDAGVARARLASEGTIELLRAAHIAPRGLAKLAAAAIDSYAGKSKEVDALIQNKGELVKLVGDFTGDGKFKAAVTTSGRTLNVRLSGKKVSDVVPVAFLAPLVAAGLYLRPEPQPVRVEPARPAPLGKPGAKPPVKPAPKAPVKPAPAPQPRR